MFTVGINRAVVLLAEKKAGGGKGRFQRAAPTVLKELGEHPSEGGKVQVLSGRYGPYVKHGDVNATLPRGKEPAALTMDEAVQLIAERAAKGPSKSKGAPRQGASQGQGRRKPARPASAKPKAEGEGPRPRSQAGGHAGSRGVGHARSGGPQTQRTPAAAGLPSKDEILEFIQHRAAPSPASARSRAPSRIKGGDRIALKQLLAEMADEGLLRRQPQGLQGARASCRPWPCSRSWPATPTAS